MGQPVAVVTKPSHTPGVLYFEMNRSLTGMGHVRYRAGQPISGNRPTDELARRLFATGEADAIHMYANVITVDLAKGFTGDGLGEIVADLFIHYRPGVVPLSFDDTASAAPDAPAAVASDGGSALSEAAKRVPANLLERSVAARKRLLGH